MADDRSMEAILIETDEEGDRKTLRLVPDEDAEAGAFEHRPGGGRSSASFGTRHTDGGARPGPGGAGMLAGHPPAGSTRQTHGSVPVATHPFPATTAPGTHPTPAPGAGGTLGGTRATTKVAGAGRGSPRPTAAAPSGLPTMQGGPRAGGRAPGVVPLAPRPTAAAPSGLPIIMHGGAHPGGQAPSVRCLIGSADDPGQVGGA